jgi:hypothetical protein
MAVTITADEAIETLLRHFKMDAPKPPPSLVRKLVALPVELVHQILTDLPVSSVLHLANYDDPYYIDDIILSHQHLRKLFPSKSQLSLAKSYYRLYDAIFRPLRWRTTTNYAYSTTPTTELSHYHHLLRNLAWPIRRALSDTTVPLALFSPTLYSQAALRPLLRADDGYRSLDTLSLLQERWMAIQAAQQTLNALRASQLRVLADLMETYRPMLKQSSDPSQERRHGGNFIHRLRLHANQTSKLPVFNCRTRTKKTFTGNGWLPIVPYDRYLRLFLKVTLRYPFKKIEAKTTFEVSHSQPPSVMASISTK